MSTRRRLLAAGVGAVVIIGLLATLADQGPLSGIPVGQWVAACCIAWLGMGTVAFLLVSSRAWRLALGGALLGPVSLALLVIPLLHPQAVLTLANLGLLLAGNLRRMPVLHRWCQRHVALLLAMIALYATALGLAILHTQATPPAVVIRR